METESDEEFMRQFRKTRKVFRDMGIDPEQLEERIAELEAVISQLEHRVFLLDEGKWDVSKVSAIATLSKLRKKGL